MAWRVCAVSMALNEASAGMRSAVSYVARTAVANAVLMHAMQRSSTVARPGRTNAHISMRGVPLMMVLRHLRHFPRLVGALLRRYVLARCLNVIHVLVTRYSTVL